MRQLTVRLWISMQKREGLIPVVSIWIYLSLLYYSASSVRCQFSYKYHSPNCNLLVQVALLFISEIKELLQMKWTRLNSYEILIVGELHHL